MSEITPPEPSPLSPALRERVEAAWRGRAGVVDEILDHCRTYRHYRELDDAGLEGLLRNVEYLVSGFYRRQIIAGRGPTRGELEGPIRNARERVAQGVPLAEMIGCYTGALPILWSSLVAALDDPAVQRELLQRVPVSIQANTVVTTAVTEAYVEERERLLRSHGEAIDELLRLFAGENAPLGVLETRARTFGLDLATPHVAVLFRPGADEPARASYRNAERVRALLDERGPTREVALGGVPGGVAALFAGGPDPAALADVAGKLRDGGWRTGVGNPGEGAAGLRRSLRQARRAVDIAELLAHPGPVHAWADLAVLDLIDIGSPRARDFAEEVLGALAQEDRASPPLQTLRALCRNGFTLKLAAAELGVHPHTLSYRLAQIRRRHGLDLDDPETRLRVHLAVLLLDV